MAPTKRRYGSEHPSAQLTDEQVLEVRRRYWDGETQAELAAAFQVSQPTINHIVRGLTWTHLPMPEGARKKTKRVMPEEQRALRRHPKSEETRQKMKEAWGPGGSRWKK